MSHTAPPEQQPTLAEHFVQYVPFVLAGIREVHHGGLPIDPETGIPTRTDEEQQQVREAMALHGIVRSRVDAGGPVPPIPGRHQSFSIDEIVWLHSCLRQTRLELSVYFSASAAVMGATYAYPRELLDIDPEVVAYTEALAEAHYANPAFIEHIEELIQLMRVAYAQIRLALELTVPDLDPDAPLLAEKHLMRGYRGAFEALLFRSSQHIDALLAMPAFAPFVTLIDAINVRMGAWYEREMFIMNTLLYNARETDAPAQRGTS